MNRFNYSSLSNSLTGFSEGLSCREILQNTIDTICNAFQVIIRDNNLAGYVIKSKEVALEWLTYPDDRFHTEKELLSELYERIPISDIEFIFETVQSNCENTIKLNRLFLLELENRSPLVTSFAIIKGIISEQDPEILHHILKMCCNEIECSKYHEANLYNPIYSLLILFQADYIEKLNSYEQLLQGIGMFDLINATSDYTFTDFNCEWWPLLYSESIQKTIARDTDKYAQIKKCLLDFVNAHNDLSLKKEIFSIIESIDYYTGLSAEDYTRDALYSSYERNGHVLSINPYKL